MVPPFVIYGKRYENLFIRNPIITAILLKFEKMIKLCSFIVLLCFLSQVTENHGIINWWWRASGCISCFRHKTRLYYDALEPISPNCAPDKYTNLKAIGKFKQYFINVCSSQPDEFQPRYDQLKDTATKTLQEFIVCFQKQGLKDDDIKKLDDAKEIFETVIQQECQDTEHPVNPPYLQDELKKFQEDYKALAGKGPQSDANPSPTKDQSKEQVDKKNLVPADTQSKDTKPGDQPSKNLPGASTENPSAPNITPKDQSASGTSPTKDTEKSKSDPSLTDKSAPNGSTTTSTKSQFQGENNPSAYAATQSFSDGRSTTNSATSTSSPQSMQPMNGYGNTNWGSGSMPSQQTSYQFQDDSDSVGPSAGMNNQRMGNYNWKPISSLEQPQPPSPKLY